MDLPHQESGYVEDNLRQICYFDFKNLKRREDAMTPVHLNTNQVVKAAQIKDTGAIPNKLTNIRK